MLRPMRSALVAIALAAIPSVSFAQDPPRPAASPYALKIQAGSRAVMARDFPGAADAFRQAIQLEPSKPDGYYFLGETQRLGGNLPESIEAFRTCVRMASQVGSDAFEGRCLQGIADSLERIEGRGEEARGAWNDAARFADSHQSNLTPQNARARVQALDAVAELERAYVPVRQRIAERERAARSP